MTSEARAWNEQRISNEVDDLTKYVTHDGKIYGMIHSEDVERLLRRVVSDEGRLCEQRVMALEAQLKESQRLHAECTTSLITADRQIERLKRERDESRRPAAEAQGEWQPLPDGTHKTISSRDISIEKDGGRVGIDFDVYDCNTGDWTPMPHYTSLPGNIRLCRRVADCKAVLADLEAHATQLSGEWTPLSVIDDSIDVPELGEVLVSVVDGLVTMRLSGNSAPFMKWKLKDHIRICQRAANASSAGAGE